MAPAAPAPAPAPAPDARGRLRAGARVVPLRKRRRPAAGARGAAAPSAGAPTDGAAAQRRRLEDAGFEDAGPQTDLENFYNTEYVGDVGVGTPPQTLAVIFDTGSSDVWFPSSSCRACGSGHARFRSSASSSYVASSSGGAPAMFSIAYGSGNVQGLQGADALLLADDLQLPLVQLGEVLQEETELQQLDMDGIVGLAFEGLAAVSRPPVVDLLPAQLASDSDLQPLFAFYLATLDSATTTPSHVSFGWYDLDLVGPTATLHYTPVYRHLSGDLRYWTVNMPGFEATSSDGRTSLRLCASSSASSYYSSSGDSCFAIVDTGTSGIGVPSAYYDDLLAFVTSGKSCVDTTCYRTTVSDFPDLTVTLYPDNVMPLRAEDYVSCSHWGECVVHLQEASSLWILGDTFIQAYYTVFEIDNLRVGFACDGNCTGGSWHGTGGFLLVEDVAPWERYAFMVALFAFMVSIIYVCFAYVPQFFARKRPRRGMRYSALYMTPVAENSYSDGFGSSESEFSDSEGFASTSSEVEVDANSFRRARPPPPSAPSGGGSGGGGGGGSGGGGGGSCAVTVIEVKHGNPPSRHAR